MTQIDSNLKLQDPEPHGPAKSSASATFLSKLEIPPSGQVLATQPLKKSVFFCLFACFSIDLQNQDLFALRVIVQPQRKMEH